MNNVLKKIMMYSLNVFLIVGVLMAFIAIKNQTYFYGWLAGSFASVVGFLLSFFITSKCGKRAKTKAQGFLIGSIKTTVVLLFHSLCLFAIMVVNAHFSHAKPWVLTINTIINPINFFAYLFGIFLVPAGIITWGIRSIRKDNNAKICHRV